MRALQIRPRAAVFVCLLGAIVLDLSSAARGNTPPDDGVPVVRPRNVTPPPPERLEAVRRALTSRSRVSVERTDTARFGQAGLGEETCVIEPIVCNQTVEGRLAVSDCVVDSNSTFADLWELQGVSGQRVAIDVSSNDFDPRALLLDPEAEVRADDDDGGPGTDSRIELTLDADGPWTITVINRVEVVGDPGDYSLGLECTTMPPATPTALTATAVSDDTIDVHWQDNAVDETRFELHLRTGDGELELAGVLPPDTEEARISNLTPDTDYTVKVRAVNSLGFSAFSNEALATTAAVSASGTCEPSEEVACLAGNRFRVEVEWADSSTAGKGKLAELLSGVGPVRIESADSALFTFFGPDNWEVAVKVLDGCALNDHHWVFAAASTDVEYTIRVTDTDQGEIATYFNALGSRAAAITDTRAFATCP